MIRGFRVAQALSNVVLSFRLWCSIVRGDLKISRKHCSSWLLIIRVRMEVVAEDAGPGIENLEKAMEDNFSTGGTMGVGLPGTRRLMDEFHIDTCPAQGTRVTVRKWI